MDKIGNTLKETQEALNKLIGFDYDTFRCSACFEQGESNSFSKLTPKESKQVVMKILQLGKLEIREQLCKDKVTTFSMEYNNIFKELEVTKTLEEVIEDDTPIKERISILEKLITNIQVEIEKAKKSIPYEIKLNELETSMERFDKLDKCPTCLQSINENHKKEILQKYKEAIRITKNSFNYEISPSLFIDNQNPRLSKLNYELGELKNKLKNIEEKKLKRTKLNTKKEELQNKLYALKRDIDTYKKLSEAFGRNGIPTNIIENTLPEIESIVNELLELLDIDMQIKIDTQKELKSGGLSDTLDINIVTNNIVRPYFGFSGGERFIIDLSLRVALSVILLRRKGLNNSTLIIDEGMGSLDEAGRNRVVKLIKVIKDKFGFKKILVISHMLDVRDNIENKIVVEKINGISKLTYNL